MFLQRQKSIYFIIRYLSARQKRVELIKTHLSALNSTFLSYPVPFWRTLWARGFNIQSSGIPDSRAPVRSVHPIRISLTGLTNDCLLSYFARLSFVQRKAGCQAQAALVSQPESSTRDNQIYPFTELSVMMYSCLKRVTCPMLLYQLIWAAFNGQQERLGR